jgi:hypothetical protein
MFNTSKEAGENPFMKTEGKSEGKGVGLFGVTAQGDSVSGNSKPPETTEASKPFLFKTNEGNPK